MVRAAVVALVAAIAMGVLAAQPASAEVRLISQTIENGYPDDLTFKLTAEADADITEVTLRYQIIGSGTGARNSPENLDPAPTVSVSLPVVTNSAASFIPVGSEISYFWEITSADGATLTTPEETYLYLPLGFAWQEVSNDFLEVWYYGENAELADDYLEATTETYELMGELLQTELPRTPARVILFANEEDSNPAKPGGGQGSFDDTITICGQHVQDSQIVFAIPQACGTPEVTDTVRHEFTHILTEVAGKGPLGDIPLWLNEGTAVLGQTEPGNGFVGPFLQAVEDDQLVPFASMAGRNNNPSQVGLYYGQSYFMVRYLIESYGPEAFAEYFATIKAGTRYDEALDVVYGFTLQGFEDEFRESFGLAPLQQQETPTPGEDDDATDTPEDEEEPTDEPAATGEDSDDDGDLNVAALAIIGVAVLFALLAVFFYLISVMFERNRLAAAVATGTEASPDSASGGQSAKAPLPPAWRPPELRNPPLAPLPDEETWAPEADAPSADSGAGEESWAPEPAPPTADSEAGERPPQAD